MALSNPAHGQMTAIPAVTEKPVVSEESDDVAWWPVAALPSDTDDSLRSLVEIATG